VVEYWNLPIKGIKKAEEEFARFGVKLDYYLYQYNAASFEKVAQKVFEKKYDGVLIAPVFQDESRKFLQECRQQNICAIMIDSTLLLNHEVAYTGQNAFQSG
jgi:LacI family transcriptional regulator